MSDTYLYVCVYTHCIFIIVITLAWEMIYIGVAFYLILLFTIYTEKCFELKFEVKNNSAQQYCM